MIILGFRLSHNNISDKKRERVVCEAYVMEGLVYSWNLPVLENMMIETLASQRTVSS